MKNDVDALLKELPCIVYRAECEPVERVTYVSAGTDKILGIDVSEFETDGLVFSRLVFPDDRDDHDRTFQSTMKSAKKFGWSAFSMEYRLLCPSGDVRHVIDQGKVERQADGSLVRSGVMIDVTAHKQAELIVAEHQSRVTTAARMYSMAEMASGIAHEINNPLTVIKARSNQLTNLLLSGQLSASPESEQLKKIGESIETMTTRIAKIVKALRMISRDGTTDGFEEADLRILIVDALELCQTKMADLGIDVSFSGLDEPIPLQCKPVQVSQTLIHLLKNAQDAVETQEKKFVRLEVTQSPDFVDISIVDSGSGIDEKIAERIFEPFYTTKEVGRGTGLGLSVSKSMVKAHGGRLRLDPLSKNTRFVITLPKDPWKTLRGAA